MLVSLLQKKFYLRKALHWHGIAICFVGTNSHSYGARWGIILTTTSTDSKSKNRSIPKFRHKSYFPKEDNTFHSTEDLLYTFV